jgi:hypothetical protein
MKYFILITIFTLFNFITKISAEELDCQKFKKFSVEYFKCKGNLIKEKTISGSKNIIKDTKDYQDQQWSEEKKKLDETKKKVNKIKKEVLEK